MNKPQLTNIQIGDSFRAIQVKGLAGMIIPPHHSTGEAIIVVQEGQALLKMPESDHILVKGSSFVIPAGKEHVLSIINNLTAVIVMAVDSKINFI